ncbi:MAG: ATPase, T2SS/T4P/T4SS family [Phycisphaeraceae bacterium]
MDGPYIRIDSEDNGSSQIALKEQPVTIGRHSDNVVVLADTLASRRHCVIERCEDGYRVRDLGSRNGTLVNGDRITTTTLSSGDTITIGNTEIQFMVPGDEVVDLSPQYKQEDEQEVRKGIKLKRPKVRRKQGGFGDATLQIDAITAEHERELQQLAASLPKVGFDESQITLVNAREQVIHPSGRGLVEEEEEGGFEAVRILRLMLWLCFRIRATDLHIEPKRDHYQIRVRVDGMMVDVVNLAKALALKINSVVKILSEIDISQKRTIQEGHFTVRVPGRRVDYRVSFTPSMFDQKLVIRILDLINAPKYLRDLQLTDWMHRELSQVAKQDAGMILVCGPTGSGKTTTLYALLRSLDLQHRNVITIEDPVEYQIEGVTQMPINEQQGNTFSTLLRSVLRQDPDVILVGEIRDPETARIAMQAAITGHLVLSTVHAKDGIGTVFRLLDLDVEPYLIASGLNLVLTQRLVRQLCANCKDQRKPLPQQSRLLQQLIGSVPNIYKPAGCSACFDTGFSGRRAIFELIVANQDLRDVILREPNMAGMRTALEKTLFTSLAEGGYRLVAEAMTSFEEIDRVVGKGE